MTPGGPTRVIAASLGLSAFAIAVVAGLAADNPPETILLRAVVSMAACHVIGWIVGVTAERAVVDAIAAYESDRSISSRGAIPAGGIDLQIVEDT